MRANVTCLLVGVVVGGRECEVGGGGEEAGLREGKGRDMTETYFLADEVGGGVVEKGFEDGH